MARNIVLLVLLTLLLPYSLASGFLNVEKLPDEYPYSPNPFWLFDPGGATQWANALELYSANQTNSKVLGALTTEEKQVFAKSIAHFEKSDSYLEEAKAQYADASHWELVYQVSIGPNRLFFAPIVASKKLSALDWGLAALSESAAGANEALLVIDAETDSLEQAGASASNYTGVASGTYNELSDALKAISENRTTGNTLGSKYARALWLTKKIAKSLESKADLNLGRPSFYPEAMSLLSSSSESIFSKTVSSRRDSKSALDGMK
jgi:hypothetical protein